MLLRNLSKVFLVLAVIVLTSSVFASKKLSAANCAIYWNESIGTPEMQREAREANDINRRKGIPECPHSGPTRPGRVTPRTIEFNKIIDSEINADSEKNNETLLTYDANELTSSILSNNISLYGHPAQCYEASNDQIHCPGKCKAESRKCWTFLYGVEDGRSVYWCSCHKDQF